MKIIITETQYEFLIAEATTNPCPDNKKENELITTQDLRNGKIIEKGYCNGNENSAIVKIQKMLKKKGLLVFDGKLGYYGDKTQQAIKKLFSPQEVKGTQIGKKTLGKLEGQKAMAVATTKSKTPAADLAKKMEINYIYGVNPKLVITATLIGEAGGESDQPRAMKAIFDVLKNRAGNNNYYDIASEALKRLQFSCWNGVSRTKSGLEGYINKKKENSRWSSAMTIVNNKESGNVTKGATHYYAYSGNNALKPSNMPSWIKSMKETVRIGNHKFGIA